MLSAIWSAGSATGPVSGKVMTIGVSVCLRGRMDVGSDPVPTTVRSSSGERRDTSAVTTAQFSMPSRPVTR